MEDITIRQGETLEISVTSDDDTATTLRLVAKKDNLPAAIDETANFAAVDGKRIATIKTNDTVIALGEYKYMLTVTNAAGDIDKLPDVSDCEGDCDLPKLTICEALDLEVS